MNYLKKNWYMVLAAIVTGCGYYFSLKFGSTPPVCHPGTPCGRLLGPNSEMFQGIWWSLIWGPAFAWSTSILIVNHLRLITNTNFQKLSWKTSELLERGIGIYYGTILLGGLYTAFTWANLNTWSPVLETWIIMTWLTFLSICTAFISSLVIEMKRTCQALH